MYDQSQVLTTFNTPWGKILFHQDAIWPKPSTIFLPILYMDAHFQDINFTTSVITDDMSWSMGRVMISMIDIFYKSWMSVGQFDTNWIQISVNLARSKSSFMATLSALKGVKPDPAKVDVIIKMPSPKLKVELASFFFCMCTYLSAYIPWLSDITTTLRQLNKKSVKFIWNSTYKRVFRQAKLHIANAVTLQYFGPGQPIVLECNASGNGVGGTLLQNGQSHYFHFTCPSQTLRRGTPILRGNFWQWLLSLKSSITTSLAGILQFIWTICLWLICSKNFWMILHHGFSIYYYV